MRERIKLGIVALVQQINHLLTLYSENVLMPVQ